MLTFVSRLVQAETIATNIKQRLLDCLHLVGTASVNDRIQWLSYHVVIRRQQHGA